MQITQFLFKPDSQPDWQAVAATEPDLVLLFGAVPFMRDPALAPALRSALPRAVLAGCSTAGEIAQDRVYDGHCVVSAIRFDTSHARTASTHIGGMDDSFGAGARLAAALAPEGLRAVLLLGTGVAINGSALLAGLQAGLPAEVTISGGLAADAGAFVQTWTLGPDGCHDRQIVAVGLYGDKLTLGYGSFAGWEPFGPARKVTRAQDNILYELDGERALDVYRRYLGAYAKDLPGSGLLFPFEMLDAAHAHSGVLRTILGLDAESGSLTLAGDIDPNGFLRLMHASTEQLIDGAESAARAAAASQAPGSGDTLALLVSCVGRKLIMGDRVDEEVEAALDQFSRSTIVSGFYSNGEIGRSGFVGDCRLHNQTMTITVISET